MKLLTKSSYSYEIMYRSRHTVTKYISDKKTHAAINSKLFKKLDHVNNALDEVELATVQNRSLFGSLSFKTQDYECWNCTKTKFCQVNKFEVLERDTDSLNLAFAKKELEECIRLEMKAEWEQLRSKDCTDSFTADAVENFPPLCCDKHRKHDKREPGLFKEEFRCSEMLCLCSKTYCCYDKTSNDWKFSSKCLKKRTLEQSGDGPLEKNRIVLDEWILHLQTEVSEQRIKGSHSCNLRTN